MTVFLAGEGGVGKSRLARTVAERALQRGMTVAEGRAFAVESGVPYAIFTDALLPLLRSLDAGTLTVLTRGTGSDLVPILPSLFAPSSRGGESAADAKARLYWSLVQLIGRLAARQPLLLVLDNVQWADAVSIELLHFLSRQAHAGAIDGHLLILATYVDAERDRNAGLRAAEQSLLSLGAARVERLLPLTRDQTRELVQRTFNAPAVAVNDFAATLHEWTRGNPFFVDETLKSLVESGRITRRGECWDGWTAESLTPSRSVRDVVLERAARLSAPARSLLDVSAVLGARIRLSALAAIGTLEESALIETVDELCGAHFLSEMGSSDTSGAGASASAVAAGVAAGAVSDEASYDFSHPLVRDAIHATLGRARAQRLHDQIGEALERSYGSNATAHADELAFHYTHGTAGTAGSNAVRYLTVAGRQALARYADRAAASYLQAALQGADVLVAGSRDAEASREHVALLESLARARQRLGELDAARELWRRARVEAIAASDAHSAAAIERQMGLMAAAAGDPLTAIAHYDAALAALAALTVVEDRTAPQPEATSLVARVRLARATGLHALGRRDEALADAHDALAIATRLDDSALLARAHRALLLLHAWTGPAHEARAHGEQAIALAAASGERAIEWSAHWAMAIHAGLTGDAAATARHVRESERLADEIRSPLLQLWTADVTIEYLAGIGDWPAALAIADRAIPAARTLGQRTLLPRLLVWTGLIHRGLGDLDRARELIEEAWSLTGAGAAQSDSGTLDVHAVVPAYTGMAGYLMAVSDHARALEVGEAGLAIADRTGYVAWAIYRLLPFIIETSLYLQDHERAARYNARLRRDSEAMGHPLGLAWADTTDALLAYLGGDPARAVPLLHAARAALEQVPFVFDAARLRRHIARAMADAGDIAGAAAELREAHDIFTRLGAQREISETRDALRSLGARPPMRRGGTGEGALSAREVEIARLVALRRSNKEIALALDISPRTVGTHLSNIFGKLHVSSRGELTDLVRSSELDAEPG